MKTKKQKLIFPVFKWWDKKTRKKINIVNKHSFREEKIKTLLGIKNHPLQASFGIKDYEELQRRNSLMNFLLKNPNIRKYFRKTKLNSDIPNTGEYFLSYYFHQNASLRMPFYKDLEIFSKLLNVAKEHSEQTSMFHDYLKNTWSLFAKEEQSLAESLREDVEKATLIEGKFVVRIGYGLEKDLEEENRRRISEMPSYDRDPGILISEKEIEVHGYKKNYYGLVKNVLKKTGSWTDNKFCRFILLRHLHEFLIEKINQTKMGLHYSDAMIEKIPGYLYDEIKECFKNIFVFSKLMNYFEKERLRGVKINYFFRYDEDGLNVEIVDLNILDIENKDSLFHKVNYDLGEKNFMGYSKRKKKRLEISSNNLYSWARGLYRNRINYSVLDFFIKTFKQFEIKMSFLTPNTDKYYKWHGLDNLMNSPKNKDTYEKLVGYREFIKSQLDDLEEVSSLADIFYQKSRKWGLPLTMPTILEPTKHLVNFRKIYPIQIIGDETSMKKKVRVRDLKPIHLPEGINGQMIGLTGIHSGGKSVTHETILMMIYLGLSGVPVFGEFFVCNVMNILGLLFMEGLGNGSAAKKQVRKLVAIMKAAEKTEKNGVLMVLDELGYGTNYQGALEISRDLLYTIHSKNLSCVFTTQYSEVAEFAKNNLSAQIYQFDRKHRIKEGIGEPNMRSIMDEEGLTKKLMKWEG